jgi:hypothetical protein
VVDRRRKKITPKPSQPKPEEIEALLEDLGTDPEASKQVSTDSREQVPSAQPGPSQDAGEDHGRAYPHRLSADFDTGQYKRLKWASFDTGEPMTSILREAVEDWLKARGY